jgi:DEAD/DEAH box helicase domain-containing protein
MIRKIVFDIETTGFLKDPEADITLLAIYEYENDTYSTFLKDELPKLWPILERADVLIGYNSNSFDIPFLDRHYPGDLTRIKSLDILDEIKNAVGRRWKLDIVAQATLGIGKSSDGLTAMTWWKNGQIDKVRDYCIQDVKVTKDIYDYAMKNGKLKLKDMGQIKEFNIDTSKWEKGDGDAMTHTMPF